MRTLTVLLAALVAAKLLTHQYLYREATQDLIVRAYRDAAVVTCATAAISRTEQLDAIAWRQAQDIDLEIGRRDHKASVYLWDVEHPHWSQRYRDPVLRLVSGRARDGAVCEFDILRGTAVVTKT